MPLDPSIIEGVSRSLEKAFESGRQMGQDEARHEFFGGAAVILTASLFHAAMEQAASAIRPYASDAADFFVEEAERIQNFVTPPTVQSHDPQTDATGIVPNTAIHVKFATPVRPETITDETFYVTPAAGGSHLNGTVVFDPETTTATFTPDSDLSSGVTYTVHVHGVRASGGMILDPEYAWSFSVA